MKLNEEYATAVFDGVQLRDNSIDQLRNQESKLTNQIIFANNLLQDGVHNVAYCKLVSESLDRYEQSLDIIKAEIEARYAVMLV